MSRLAVALLLAVLLPSCSATSAAPRSAHVIPAGSVGVAEPDRGRSGASLPPAPHPSPALPADAITPGASEGPSTDEPVRANLTGLASWFRYVPGHAAAGPRLRALLGPDWRGMTVTVNGVPVVLSDWCQCYEGRADERLVDLDSRTFSRFAQLTRGLVTVEVVA